MSFFFKRVVWLKLQELITLYCLKILLIYADFGGIAGNFSDIKSVQITNFIACH